MNASVHPRQSSRDFYAYNSDLSAPRTSQSTGYADSLLASGGGLAPRLPSSDSPAEFPPRHMVHAPYATDGDAGRHGGAGSMDGQRQVSRARQVSHGLSERGLALAEAAALEEGALVANSRAWPSLSGTHGSSRIASFGHHSSLGTGTLSEVQHRSIDASDALPESITVTLPQPPPPPVAVMPPPAAPQISTAGSPRGVTSHSPSPSAPALPAFDPLAGATPAFHPSAGAVPPRRATPAQRDRMNEEVAAQLEYIEKGPFSPQLREELTQVCCSTSQVGRQV
jgi:hypothetical protein